MKSCKECNTEKEIDQFRLRYARGMEYRRPVCIDCENKDSLDRYHRLSNEQKHARQQQTRDKLGKGYFKSWKLKAKYNLTIEEYHVMYQQQYGKCAICFREIDGEAVNVDHDHETHKVRGLLCRRCNTGLGTFQDNIELLESCIKYLREHS